MTVRLIKREAVFKCESYEVHFPDGRPSRFFCWDDGDRLTSCLDRRVMYLRAIISNSLSHCGKLHLDFTG